MASDALLRGPSPASYTINGLRERFNTSQYSSCSFLSVKMPKGSRTPGPLVANVGSVQKSAFCEAMTPLTKVEQRVCVDICEPGRNSSFPADACEPEQNSSFPDRWIEECVSDIVKNINEAPFLHLLFNSKDSGSGVKSQRQRVGESNHLNIEDKWREVRDLIKNASPDGVILVQHLDDESMEGCCLRDGLSSHSTDGNNHRTSRKCYPSTTNLWGLVVVGKGVAKIACYILKTTSVSSSFGICTQFCLTKAKCFGPSWQEQMQSCWLL